jgi:hypothetical protein
MQPGVYYFLGVADNAFAHFLWQMDEIILYTLNKNVDCHCDRGDTLHTSVRIFSERVSISVFPATVYDVGPQVPS